MNKAFFVSLDSIVAILLAFALLASSLFISGKIQSRAAEEASLKIASEDVLTVLEKTGRIFLTPQAGGVSEVQEVFLTSPDSTCFRLRVFKASNARLYRAVTKPGCGQPGEFSQATKRSFVFNREFYFAELTSWRRKA